jgi:hypothetical protein
MSLHLAHCLGNTADEPCRSQHCIKEGAPGCISDLWCLEVAALPSLPNFISFQLRGQDAQRASPTTQGCSNLCFHHISASAAPQFLLQ